MSVAVISGVKKNVVAPAPVKNLFPQCSPLLALFLTQFPIQVPTGRIEPVSGRMGTANGRF